MVHGGRKNISLALSGGGTRAALFSGGFLLAVQQAVNEKKVTVVEVHAVSGSSLLLASLVIADQDTAGDQFKGYSDQSLLMLAIENIARKGFAGRPVTKAATGAVLTAVVASFLFASASPPVTGLALNFVFASTLFSSFFAYLWASFRFNPFALWASRNPAKNFRQIPKHWLLEPSKPSGLYLGFLPAGNLHFGATNSETGEVKWFNAHKRYQSKDGAETTFGQIVKVSAAFPLVVSFEEIEGIRHIDGGVSDNTAMSAERKSGSVVYLANACVPYQPPEKSEVGWPRWTSWLLAAGSAAAFFFGVYLLVRDFLWSTQLQPAVRWFYSNVFVGLTALIIFLPLTRRGAKAASAVRSHYTTDKRAVTSSIQQLALHRAHTKVAKSKGIEVIEVDLTSDPTFSCPNHAGDLRTTLGAIESESATRLVNHGYLSTAEKLGLEHDMKITSFIASLSPEKVNFFRGWLLRQILLPAKSTLRGVVGRSKASSCPEGCRQRLVE